MGRSITTFTTIEQTNLKKKDSIKAQNISIKLSKIECKNEDIKKYFQDFGLFNNFILQLNDYSCSIF